MKPTNSAILIALFVVSSLGSLLVVGCNPGDKSSKTQPVETNEEPPPSTSVIQKEVEQGLDKACELDTDCAMYLRCYDAKCQVPPAMTGEPIGDDPVPAIAIVAAPGEAQFHLELTTTAEERSRGLMFRQTMSDEWGMLFIYPSQKKLTFWMKNTYIPLDMVFISSDHHVVGVVHDAVPHTTESRQVEGESQYVLELNAGLANRYGIKAGDKVVFANLP